VNDTDWRDNRLIASPPSRQRDLGDYGATMFGLAKITGRQRALWLGVCLSVAPKMAIAEPVCVTCVKPVMNIQCEIRKSQSLEGLPFAEKLIGRACAKAVKASVGASGCHVAKDTVCPNWPLKSLSLKEAKRALLGETPPALTDDDQDPLAKAVAAPPAETKWSLFVRPIANAWQKFLALIAWR